MILKFENVTNLGEQKEFRIYLRDFQSSSLITREKLTDFFDFLTFFD